MKFESSVVKYKKNSAKWNYYPEMVVKAMP